MGEYQARECISKLGICMQSLWALTVCTIGTAGADGCHGENTLHYLSLIMVSGTGAGGWRKANATSIFKKGRKDEGRKNHRPVSLIPIPGKVMKQLIPVTISRPPLSSSDKKIIELSVWLYQGEISLD